MNNGLFAFMVIQINKLLVSGRLFLTHSEQFDLN